MPLWIKFASVFASLSLIQTSIYVASVFVVSPSADYKIEFTFFGIFCMLVALVTQVPVSMGWNWIGGATTKTFHRQQLCYLPFILIKVLHSFGDSNKRKTHLELMDKILLRLVRVMCKYMILKRILTDFSFLMG